MYLTLKKKIFEKINISDGMTFYDCLNYGL